MKERTLVLKSKVEMVTRKAAKQVQTCKWLVHRKNATAQTGYTPYLATSETVIHDVQQERSVQEKMVTPFVTPFEPDSFGWFEEGRAAQTSPTLGRTTRATQTPAIRNSRKMMRSRGKNKTLKVQEKRPTDESECPGNTQKTYTHNHTKKSEMNRYRN